MLAYFYEVIFDQGARHLRQCMSRVEPACGDLQGRAADVGTEDVNLPSPTATAYLLAYRHGDGIRLFARRAARAPDAEGARALAGLALLQLGENSSGKPVKCGRVTEERRLSGKQCFQ